MNNKKSFISDFEIYIKSITSLIILSFQISSLIGGICSVLYLWRINYLPSELTLGDGFLFLLVAGGFGVIYGFFVWSSLAFGIFISPLIIKIFQFVITLINYFREKKGRKRIKQYFLFAPFEFISILLVPFFILMVYVLDKNNTGEWWFYLILAALLYIFYSIWKDARRQLNFAEKITHIPLTKKDVEDYPALQRLSVSDLKVIRWITPLVIFIIPILVGWMIFGGVILDMGMGFARIRVENPSVVYVKKPYSELLPYSLISTEQKKLDDYVAFTNTKILFRGLGKSTVISFQDGKFERQIALPNEQLVIEEKKEIKKLK